MTSESGGTPQDPRAGRRRPRGRPLRTGTAPRHHRRHRTGRNRIERKRGDRRGRPAAPRCRPDGPVDARARRHRGDPADQRRPPVEPGARADLVLRPDPGSSTRSRRAPTATCSSTPSPTTSPTRSEPCTPAASPLDPKAARALVESRRPARDTPQLTDREREVLLLVRDGLANKQIARRLGIAERTVKAHLTSIFQRLGVTDRTQAALWASEHLADRDSTLERHRLDRPEFVSRPGPVSSECRSPDPDPEPLPEPDDPDPDPEPDPEPEPEPESSSGSGSGTGSSTMVVDGGRDAGCGRRRSVCDPSRSSSPSSPPARARRARRCRGVRGRRLLGHHGGWARARGTGRAGGRDAGLDRRADGWRLVGSHGVLPDRLRGRRPQAREQVLADRVRGADGSDHDDRGHDGDHPGPGDPGPASAARRTRAASARVSRPEGTREKTGGRCDGSSPCPWSSQFSLTGSTLTCRPAPEPSDDGRSTSPTTCGRARQATVNS